MEKEKVPDGIITALNAWRWQSITLRILHVLLGMAAVVASITVASRVITNTDTLSWIAWFAAITAGILTSVGLETKSNNMRSAWRILNTAVIRYQTEEDFTIKTVK